ncbi:hypothetical protein [Spirosoma pomorum]
MQAFSLKISLFFLFLVTSFQSRATSPTLVSQADSLFATGDQAHAAQLYEKVLDAGYEATNTMLLKLASAYEQQDNIPRLLYFLQVYFDHQPDDAVLHKMNEIARANNLDGYETDDLNYFFLFYRKYGIYILIFLLLPAGYVFTVLILKGLRRQPAPLRQKWVLFIYLLVLLAFVNLPDSVQSGITNNNRVMIRTAPSAAAPVVDVIGQGHKVNILGSRDIYLRVLWHNKLYFIRRDNIWVI